MCRVQEVDRGVIMIGSKYFEWAKNDEWYYFDDDGTVHLTDKAPEEAVESLKLLRELEKKDMESGILH